MRGRLYVLAVSTLIIVSTAFYACAPCEEYLPVTIEELIGNFSAYDGQNVKVTGVFIADVNQFGNITCYFAAFPCRNATIEENLDKYYPYYESSWGISSSGNKQEENVVAFMPDGTSKWNDFPDWEEEQQIEIRGKAHVTTIVLPSCNPTCYLVKRSSIYITVLPENVKIIPGQ